MGEKGIVAGLQNSQNVDYDCKEQSKKSYRKNGKCICDAEFECKAVGDDVILIISITATDEQKNKYPGLQKAIDSAMERITQHELQHDKILRDTLQPFSVTGHGEDAKSEHAACLKAGVDANRQAFEKKKAIRKEEKGKQRKFDDEDTDKVSDDVMKILNEGLK